MSDRDAIADGVERGMLRVFKKLGIESTALNDGEMEVLADVVELNYHLDSRLTRAERSLWDQALPILKRVLAGKAGE